MTTDPTPASSDAAPTPEELQVQAIATLTAIARQTYPTDHGDHPSDFAGELASILAAVTANVGGTDTLLAGRSGSWEAAAVRTLVDGTVGPEDEYLSSYRTEPIRVWIDPEAQLLDVMGMRWFEAWDVHAQQVGAVVNDAYDAALKRHAGDPLVVAPERRQLVQNILGAGKPPTDEQRAVWAELEREGPYLRELEPTLRAAEDAAEAVAAEQRRQERAYGDALLAAAQAEAVRLGYTVPVIATSDYNGDDPIAYQLGEVARATVPVPTPPAAPDSATEDSRG